MILLTLGLLVGLFWVAFKLTGAILAALVWLIFNLPAALILFTLGLACCCTLILIPIGIKLFGLGAKILV